MSFSLFPSILLLITVFSGSKAFEIDAASKAGKRMLSKARRLNDNNNYDYTWMAGYSLKFQSCHTLLQFDDQGGREQEDADGSPIRQQGMIKFTLCPTDSCGSKCDGPEYIAQMRDFIETYQEAKQNLKEYQCQNIEDNCACDDDNVDDETCLSNCYTIAGIDCGQNDDGDGEEENNIEELVECRQMGEDNDDGSSSYYTGGYCGDDGKSVYLGVFSDRGCSNKVSTDIFYNKNGYELPYTSESIVDNNCLQCGYDNGNDDEYNVEISESCENIYEGAGKCEEGFSDVISYPNSGSCEFINKILPGLEKLQSRNFKIGGGASVAFAWIFTLTTMGLIGYIYILTDGKFLKEGKVNLVSSVGGLA